MNRKTVKPGRKPISDRSHPPDYAVAFAVRHPTKYEALVVLQEEEHTTKEVADLIGRDVKHVDAHIKELFKAGCIELAGYREGRQAAVYRAIVQPDISDEIARTMSVEERHDLSGVVAQDILAEMMSAYRNGKLDEDPVCLWWDARPLDSIARSDIHALLLTTRKRIKEIVVEATLRMRDSGETGQMTFFSVLGFERGRPGQPKGADATTGISEQ